jgi:hypothetical protein
VSSDGLLVELVAESLVELLAELLVELPPDSSPESEGAEVWLPVDVLPDPSAEAPEDDVELLVSLEALALDVGDEDADVRLMVCVALVAAVSCAAVVVVPVASACEGVSVIVLGPLEDWEQAAVETKRPPTSREFRIVITDF